MKKVTSYSKSYSKKYIDISMDDLDSLLKQLGQAAGGPEGATGESNESDLDTLLNSLRTPASSLSSSLLSTSTPPASSFAGPLPVTTLPQPSRIIPDSIKEYRPSTLDLLPSKPISTIFGFTGPMRHINPFNPAAKSESTNEKYVISKKAKITEYDCDPGLIIHPDIGHKLEYPQHKFNEFITTIVFDPNAYSTLQKCIDSIPPYSILQVPDGKYKESLKCKSPIFIQGIGNVTISSNDGIIIMCQESVMENLTFDGEFCRGITVTITNGVSRFSNCKIKGGQQVTIQAEGKAHVELKDCKISKGQKMGICVNDTAAVVCVDTTVKKSASFGVVCQNYSKLSMDNCTITSSAKCGLGIYDRSSASVCGCRIIKNGKMGMEVQSRGNDVYFEDNTFDSNGAAGALISQRAHVTFVNNVFSNHQMSGIEAKEGSRLIMHGNRLSNTNDNPLLYLVNKARAYSDHDTFSGQCKAAVGAVNGAYFLGRHGQFDSLKICGILTFDMGRVNLQMCDFLHNDGVAIQAKSSLLMRNCSFSDSPENFLTISGGASGRAVNCSFKESKIGIRISEIDDYIFDNCVFSEAEGTGVRIDGATSPKFIDCKFYQHKKMGCTILGEGKPTFEFCDFISCSNGCFCVQGCRPSFVGCTFAQNNSYGFSADGAHPNFTNCLFSENRVLGFNAINGSKVTIKNCQISENEEYGGQIGSNGTCVDLNGCVVIKQGKTGIFIMDAECNIKNSQFRENISSHISSKNASTVNIEDSEFTNSANGQGLIFDNNSKAVIKGSDFHHEVKAIIVSGKSNFDIQKSTIHDNSQCGICFLEQCKFSIDDCEVKENAKTGIYINGDKNAMSGEIKNCIISNNKQNGIETNFEFKQSNNRMACNKEDIHKK